MDQICDEVAAIGASKFGLRLLGVIQQMSRPDAIANARYEEFVQTVAPNMRGSMQTAWFRRLYQAVGQDGTEYVVLTESEVSAFGYEAVQERRQQDGGNFLNLMGHMANTLGSAIRQKGWQTDYELFCYCPTEEFPTVFGELNHVRESIRKGADFAPMEAQLSQFMQQSIMQIQGSVNNAVGQMMADNVAHFDRMSAIVQDTNNYTTGAMHDMMAANAATNEHIANMNSEMIGGYDVYQGTNGNLVQADIAYDHVYQGNVGGQDWLVGVEGDWLEPGVDFVPLGHIQGGRY